MISIVTPSFNQATFLEQTLQSVARQEHTRFEHIVVDGGSTDGSLQILQRREQTDNLHWISEPDQGQADAVNKGFAMAKGDVIGWLNSDDVYVDTSVLRTVVDYFDRYPDVSVIYGDSVIIDENGLILKVLCHPPFRYGHLLRDCFITQPSVFLRRDVVERHQLRTDLQYAMDYEYWLRLSNEYRFQHVHKILSADRTHVDRKMVAQREALAEESQRVRTTYGISRGWRSHGARVMDKLYGGLGRACGLRKALLLYTKTDFAFPARMDSRFALAYRQLAMKNKDLLE